MSTQLDPPGGGPGVSGALRTKRVAGGLLAVVVGAVFGIGWMLGGATGPGGDVAAATPPVASASAPIAAATVTAGLPTPAPSEAVAASGVPVSTGSATASAPAPSASASAAPTPAPTPSHDASGIPSAALQARLDKLRAKLSIPGTSVAILWDDGRQWLGASGLRDVAAGDPMTTGTGFALASVSKTFTAAVVLQLVEEGKLRLDTRVAPLLPQYPMDPGITVRQLLDHTSGIPDYFLNAKIDRPLQDGKDEAWTPDMAWAYVPPVRKRFPPGRIWLYSNANYLLLGELVERVTGQPLAREIRDRLLDPLGLDAAWYQAVEKPRAKGTLAYRMVPLPGGGFRIAPVAHRSPVMPFRSVVTAAAGAGSIAATAEDAARWMRAYAGGDVLEPGIMRAMLADLKVTHRLRAEIPYGLGIQAVPIAGRPALGHSGRFLGFRNVVRYLPGEGITIAVLTNQGTQDPARIAEGLLKLILPPLEPSGTTPSR